MNRLLWALLLSGALALPQNISTIAGGATFPPGRATSLPVGDVSYAAMDTAGNFYLSIPSLNQVYKLDTAGNLSPFAGSRHAGFAGDGGPATSAVFNNPSHLAADGAGNVYILDSFNFRIRKVDRSGFVTTVAGNGSGPLSLSPDGPAASGSYGFSGLAADSAGNLYFSEYNYHVVRKVTTQGMVVTIAGSGAPASSGDGGQASLAQVKNPGAVILDSGGNLYVGEYVSFFTSQVRKISTSGVISTVCASRTPGSLAVKANGELHVSGDGLLFRCEANGTSTLLTPHQSSYNGEGAHISNTGISPRGIVAGSNGNLFVCDPHNYRFRKVDAAGIVTTVAGDGTFDYYGAGGPAISAHLSSVIGLAFDTQGTLYLSDTVENRVSKISRSGVFTRVAGYTYGYWGDGLNGLDAQLARPGSVAADSSGNLYIADFENHRVRVISTGNVIRTFAGTGSATGPGGLGGPATSAVVSAPSSVAVDPSGRVLIASGGTVLRVAADGTISRIAGGGATPPTAGVRATDAGLSISKIAVDKNGQLLMTDRRARMIWRVTQDGLLAAVAGDGSGVYSGDGGPAVSAGVTPSFENALAVDELGNIYFAEFARIRKISPTGIITTIAGTGVAGYAGDGGPASQSLVHYVTGLAVDPVGNLYFADSWNGRIRKIESKLAAVRALSPSSAGVGSPGLTLAVSGANFTPQSQVLWNGVPRSTTYIGPETLSAQIGAADLASAGKASVAVYDPANSTYNSIGFDVLLVAPQVPSTPNPADLSSAVSTAPVLTWTSNGASSFDVYFGTGSNPPFAAAVTAASYTPASLAAATTYYWRVVARNSASSATSPVWRFTTAQPAAPTGLRFVAIAPCRAVDSRAGQGTSGNFGPPAWNANTTRELPMASSRCAIPATAQAYSLNVTVVPHEPLGYLSLWPTGQAKPLVSTLNSFHGGIVANAAIVPAGAQGSISAFVTNKADVIVDINGYFEAAGGLSFYALDPCRVADTRAGSGFTGAFGPPTPGAAGMRTLPLPSGACGVPGSAGAYSLNVTAVPAAGLGYLTAWPTGQAQPFVSTLNSPDGSVVANAAIVPAGTAGAVNVFVTDPADTIVDINGYFGPSGGAGELRFHPLAPCRTADTREAAAAPALLGGVKRDFTIAGRCGVPGTAKAVSLNVTVVPDGPLGYVALWPAGRTQPLVSTLNSFAGRVVANAAQARLGTGGAVSVYATNPTHLVLDVNGYFE